MATFYALAFSISFGAFVATGLMSSIPDFATLCPYNDFCTSKAKFSIAPTSGMESCCVKCSSATDCDKVGNCCPDVRNKTNITPVYQCKALHNILNTPRNIYDAYGINEQLFRIVDSCPDSNSSSNFPACKNPTKIEDYVVVSNVENEKVYKNRHCAMCHGVQEYIEWDLLAKCPEILSATFQTFNERDDFVLKNCSLDARPPNKDIVEIAGCYYDYQLTRTCFISGLINTGYDVIDLYKACQARRPGQNTVYRDSNSKLYSNIYCYLCNTPGLTEAPGLCDIPEEDTFREVSFSCALQLKKSDEVQSRVHNQCAQSETLDRHAGLCRTVHCPFGTIPVDGICETFVVYSEGHILYTLFEVKFLIGKPFFSKYLLRKIRSHILGFIALTPGCRSCRSELFQSNGNTYFQGNMYTSNSCPVSLILETFRSLVAWIEDTTLICGNNGDEHRFTLTFVKERLSYSVNDEAFAGNPCSNAATQVELQMLHSCPRFVMPITELYDTPSDTSPYADSPGLVSICADKYFQTLQIEQSDAIFWQPNKFMFATIVTLHVLIIIMH